MTVLLELPLSVVERTDLPGLQPSGDAVEVERMITHTPSHRAFLTGGGRLVRLALDAQIHDVISANRTVVHHDVPGPQGYRVPLLDLEPLPLTSAAAGRRCLELFLVDIHVAWRRFCPGHAIGARKHNVNLIPLARWVVRFYAEFFANRTKKFRKAAAEQKCSYLGNRDGVFLLH